MTQPLFVQAALLFTRLELTCPSFFFWSVSSSFLPQDLHTPLCLERYSPRSFCASSHSRMSSNTGSLEEPHLTILTRAASPYICHWVHRPVLLFYFCTALRHVGFARKQSFRSNFASGKFMSFSRSSPEEGKANKRIGQMGGSWATGVFSTKASAKPTVNFWSFNGPLEMYQVSARGAKFLFPHVNQFLDASCRREAEQLCSVKTIPKESWQRTLSVCSTPSSLGSMFFCTEWGHR